MSHFLRRIANGRECAAGLTARPASDRTSARELNVGQAVAVESANGGRVPASNAGAGCLTGERLSAAASRARRAAQGRRERSVGVRSAPVSPIRERRAKSSIQLGSGPRA